MSDTWAPLCILSPWSSIINLSLSSITFLGSQIQYHTDLHQGNLFYLPCQTQSLTSTLFFLSSQPWQTLKFFSRSPSLQSFFWVVKFNIKQIHKNAASCLIRNLKIHLTVVDEELWFDCWRRNFLEKLHSTYIYPQEVQIIEF